MPAAELVTRHNHGAEGCVCLEASCKHSFPLCVLVALLAKRWSSSPASTPPLQRAGAIARGAAPRRLLVQPGTTYAKRGMAMPLEVCWLCVCVCTWTEGTPCISLFAAWH